MIAQTRDEDWTSVKYAYMVRCNYERREADVNTIID